MFRRKAGFQSDLGHSLLEALIATGIFVMVAVALIAVWVMYSRSLAKAGEVLSANSIARSVTEGLTSNGWDWLKTRGAQPASVRQEDIVVKRRVRARQADIRYHVSYSLDFNTAGAMVGPDLSEDLCSILVTVHWRGDTGDKAIPGTDFNNEAVYTAFVYKHGI